MSEGMVRSLGSRRFLDWRALDADGVTGDSGIWKTMLSECSRESMGRSPKEKRMLVGRDWGN
ncbi:hypothetical protein CK203_023844 [Vitis vinifera]|uniref:Uncharacterized protein n=1 Tax=Vitis vinifera TaxID=29760 RepID=A0A438JA01_VITVI|nr:hypothetical protein CK203_023844 [Vitis vinifera]